MVNDRIKLYEAERALLTPLRQLEAACHAASDCWPAEQWARVLKAHEFSGLVADHRGAIVGAALAYVQLAPGEPHVHFERILVAPAYRRQGLGRRLVHELVRYAAPGAIVHAETTEQDLAGQLFLRDGLGLLCQATLRGEGRATRDLYLFQGRLQPGLPTAARRPRADLGDC